MVSEVISVFKFFIINYDGSVLNNLERELDLVHDLYLGLEINEEDITVSSTRRTGDECIQNQSQAFERSNFKSVLTSFNIHLKEVAALSLQIKGEQVVSTRNLGMIKQRLQAAMSCVHNLELLAEIQNRSERSTAAEKRGMPEQAPIPTNVLPVVEDCAGQCRQLVIAENDDVYLGEASADLDHLSSSTGSMPSKVLSGNRELLSKLDQELLSHEQLLLSHKKILCELNSVITHRVQEQKIKENDLIEKKYGSEAVRNMGWDATIAPLRSMYFSNCHHSPVVVSSTPNFS